MPLGDMFGQSFAAVNGGKPAKSDRIQPGQPLNMRGAFEAATNIPGVGDALSGLMAAYDGVNGEYSSAIANALGVLPFISASVTKPAGTSKIAQRMADAFSKDAADEVGTIEANHLAKWGKSSDPALLFGVDDAEHSLKRIAEGMTPQEISEVAFRATQKNAHAAVEPNGYLKLTSPIAMKFADSPLFKPQAIIRNVDGENHLYGVVPKGWKGRK